MGKYCAIICLFFNCTVTLASSECFVALNGVLTKHNSNLSSFLRKNKKVLGKLSKSGVINENDITLDNIIFVKNKSNNSIGYVFASNDNLILLDSTLPKGYEVVQGKAFGFNDTLNLENRYQILRGNFVIKTLNEKTVLLPKNQFGDNVVEEFAKSYNGENSRYVKKWSRELQSIVSTPIKEESGKYSVFPVAALEKAKFYEVSLISQPNDKLTLMTLNGKVYFLTEEPYAWLGTSNRSGLLRPLQTAYQSEGKILRFKTDKGIKVFYSSKSGGFFVDEGNSLAGLFKVINESNPKEGVSFEKIFSDDVLELIIANELFNIKRTQLFKITGKNNDYVLFLNDQVFYLTKDKGSFFNIESNWTEITKSGPGFTNPKDFDLILEERYLLRVTNKGIALVPIIEKVPVFLDELIQNPKLPESLREIITTYKLEFVELLKSTPLTRSEFVNAQFRFVIDSKTGKKVLYMESQNLKVFFSPERIPGDKLFEKNKFYILNSQTEIGFDSFEERIFLIPNELEIKISAKGMEVSPLNIEPFTKAQIDKILSKEVDIPPFFKEMINNNRDELERLISKKRISLVDILPGRSSFAITADGTEKYWIIPTKDDLLLFDLNSVQPPLSFQEKGKDHFQFTLLLEDGSSRIRKNAIGFNTEADTYSIVEASLTGEEIKKVFIAKIENTLKRDLNQIESETIFKAFAYGLNEVGADGKNAAQIGNFTKEQIIEKAKILKESGLFTDEEIKKIFFYRHL